MKHTEHNAFLNEALESINRIYKENKHLTQLRWFLEIALQRFNKDYLNSRKPQVIVLGDDIPAEVLYAVCDDPFYVLGGSLGTAHWADELTPRDTDPFSRSSLGWLINPEFDLTENALIMTAVSSDSRRKLISVLQNNGRKVAALDIPPNQSANAVHYYTEQLTELAEKIGRHTRKRFTGSNLKRAVKRVANARYQRHRFLSTALSSGNVITDEAVLFANQCMYFSDDIDEWAFHIKALGNELEQFCRRYAFPKKDKPNVMILGSPVVFPNYKVPQLITSAGMNITAVADSLSLGASVAVPRIKAFVTTDSLLQQIAQTHLKMISSGARVNNEGLYAYFMHLVRQLHPDGIVCHILKGQIEYDFELPRIEKAAEELDIPVFRLETDYQYQDMEQLRIRMEAFGEMLMQRKIVSNKRRRTA
ncbi:MAG: 2-hydroxyacyl-CoA dehydratase family protein [Ruminococcus sp.]|nr:2-hydroxyacyl-CoA dehydratase family protein [Ruminococcus sp.]